MNIATLGVAIDPTQAQQGAAAANKAMQSMEQQAGRTSAAVRSTGQAAGQAAAQSGQQQAQAHQGLLSRMAESIRGFFGRTNAGAQQTHAAFAGMVGQVVNFLQNILSMVPGAAGAFASLAGAVGGAATGMAGFAAASGTAMVALAPLVAVVLALLAALVALGATAAVTWKALGAAGAMEQLEVQFTVLLGSVEKAKKTLEELTAFADKTPFDTKGVMSFGTQMLNAGVKAEDLTRELTILGDSSLGNFDKMTTAVSVYTQTMMLGKLETEDFKRMQEQGIPIMEGLEKHFKKNATAIREMMSDGKVTFADFQAGLKNIAGEGGRLAGMMDKMSQTWDGRMSTIASRWDTILTKFGTPIKDVLGPVLVDIDNWLVGLIPKAQAVGQALADGLQVAIGAVRNGTWLELLGLELRAAATEAFVEAVEVLIAAPREIKNELDAAATAFVEKFIELKNAAFWDPFGDILYGIAAHFGNDVMAWMQKAGAAIGAAMEVAANMAKNIVNSIPFVGDKNAPTLPTDIKAAYNTRAAAIDAERAEKQNRNLDQIANGINQLGLNDDFGGDLGIDLNQFEDAGSKLLEGAKESAKADRARADQLREEARKAGKPQGIDWSGLKEPQRDSALKAAEDAKKGGKGGRGAADEFRGDAYLIQEMQKQLVKMRELQTAGQMTTTEFSRRETDLKDKTAGQLADPTNYEEELGKWRAYQEEKKRVAQQTTVDIENGSAGMWESFTAGMDQATQDWDNMSKQMAKLGAGVAQSLSTNMTNAFTAMVTGSKSAEEAFRDMAIAILNDIAKMIIQLLVELAIRTAIKAVSGYAKGGSTGGTAEAGSDAYMQSFIGAGYARGGMVRGYATGGPVWGGNGGIDDIPAYLTAGEYVIPKDAADFYGTRFLDAVRDKKARRAGFAEGGSVAAGQVRQMALAQQKGSANGDGVNVSFSVHVGGEEGETREQKRKKGERLAKQMESMARQVVRDEMRNGGALSNRR